MPENDNAHILFTLDDVTKSFNGGPPVLDGISIDIAQNRTTVIIGPSGCGKSVLLKNMVGLIRPEKGRIVFEGHDITAMKERELVSFRRQMGFLFQGGALFDSMTVEDNIVFPMKEHGIGNEEARKARCREVLGLIGLDGMEQRYPAELSGGQKKRIALARAIVLDPEVIFYDEPTTGLDPVRADLINELIIMLKVTLGNTAMVVTHDIASAKKIGDRILMLHEGKFILDVPPEKLENADNEIVTRFVNGQAGPDELAKLRSGRERIT